MSPKPGGKRYRNFSTKAQPNLEGEEGVPLTRTNPLTQLDMCVCAVLLGCAFGEVFC